MRLSLRWKIAGGFGILVVLILALSWITFSLFGSLRGVQRKVFDDAIPGLVAVDEIVRSYTAQSAAVRGYLIGSQQTLLAQYRVELDIAEFWEERAENLFTDESERALLDDLVEAGSSFQLLVDDEVLPLAEAGERSQAFRVLGQEGTPLISEIERLGTLLREAQGEVVAATEESVRRASNQTVVILLLVTIAIVLLGVFLAILLPRALVGNLSKLVDATRAIGRGDLDQEIDIHSGDEVEELATRLREMQSGLKRLQQLALQDRELEIAASIQRNLLQRTVPEPDGARLVPLQRQANLVGGDWYDVDATATELTVAVGDASGKGIGAALMATVALSALRAERSAGSAARQIVARVNTALRDATDADSFTTLLYAVLDCSSGQLRMLNMGHPAPYLLPTPGTDRRGHYVEGPRNRAVGWFADPGFETTSVLLERGDRLVLFTDGFLEAKSSGGEVFGEHRLEDALVRLTGLDSAAIVDELVREVESFAAGKLDDDLTMLVIEYVGTGAPPAAGPAPA
ncbi:MAG TPA: SpoIIE family protein phosphatase [Actinomycetota bacterium]|nr:SpoIIE family protein phosphatase [Actinomycetota bacterium]